VKVWDLDEFAYVESLYGHSGPVNSVDSMFGETALSSGDDCTLRFWKVIDETQLIFKGHSFSIDCAKLLNEKCFISGGQDGKLAFWTKEKKKAFSVCF
jgi:ribosomal RNA-processing protein 9